VIVIDDAADICHKYPDYKIPCKQHVGVATPFTQPAFRDQKSIGGVNVVQAKATHQKDMSTTLKNNGHFTYNQPKKPSFLTSYQPSNRHESSRSIARNQTTKNQSYRSSDQKQVQSCNKRTWNEVNDEDDEFDELCQMVDLSDSFDDNEPVITPGSGHSWTCPMCNEVLIGK